MRLWLRSCPTSQFRSTSRKPLRFAGPLRWPRDTDTNPMIEVPSSLVCYPGIAMGRFGKVDDADGGHNKYRLIYAPSRRVILMLDRGATTVQFYLTVEPLSNPNVWLLEKWMKVEAYTHLTKEEWNADPMSLRMGPYPKGAWQMAGPPLTCTPDQANIDKLVQWIETKRYTPAQNAIAIQNKVHAEEQARSAKVGDMIRDRLLPYGGEAWAGRGNKTGRVGRNPKTVNTKYSANELGLPTKSGSTGLVPRQRPVTYEVPLH